MLDFGDGRQVSFVCSTQTVSHQSLELIGTKGRVELVIPFNAPADTATAIIVDNGYAPDGHLAAPRDHPALRPVHRAGRTPSAAPSSTTSHSNGASKTPILSMKVLDAIFASEKTGAWASV